MKRRILAVALILMMILTMTSVPAFAASRSRIHSLRLRQDSFNQRVIHINWENEDDIECNITITRIESNGKAVNYEVVNEWVEDEYYEFKEALPITTYRVTVYQFGSGDVISKTIALGKAPSYNDAGAVCNGGTMYWIDRDDLERDRDPWESGVNRREYTKMNTTQFANMLHDYQFYGMSSFSNRYEFHDHDIQVLYILRGPDGHDVFREENNFLSDTPANRTWRWYYPLEDLIWEMSGTGSLTQPGSYMFEVYFDECRLSRKEFVITR